MFGLKWLTILMALYAAVWISLEGALWRATVMGVGVAAVSAGHLLRKYRQKRPLGEWHWLIAMAVTGLLIGLASGPLTLLFMSLKTGLHAHGPEFTPAEINWILQQIPVWTAAGLLAGLGLGLVFKGGR